MREYGFGRIHVPDDRDKSFPLEGQLSLSRNLASRYWWAAGFWFDVGGEPWAVEAAFHHWLCDVPVGRKKAALWAPGTLYADARATDGIIDHEGTTIRSVAELLRARGLISSYLWAWDLRTTLLALATDGPVILGCNWHAAMMYPNAEGLVRVSGRVLGQTAVLLDGIDYELGTVRVKGNWGRSWGRKGFCSLTFGDLDTLIRAEGEICSPRRDAP